MNMLSKVAFSAACALALSTGVAQANAIYSFNDAVLTNGDTVSGILETNQYGYFGVEQLVLKDSSDNVIETFSDPAPQIDAGGTFVQVFDTYANSLFLYFDNSIDGYGPVSLITTKSFLCSSSYALDCGGGTFNDPATPQTFFAPFSRDSVNDPLSVPEPPAWCLLVVGILGLFALSWPRLRKARA